MGLGFDDTINEEELDLLEIVTADTKNMTSQFLIFRDYRDELFAINVSKIRELLEFHELDMIKNEQAKGFIKATADVRGNLIPIVYFDEWFSGKKLDDSEYKLVILASFGGHEFGIVVKNVEYIATILPEHMQESNDKELKATFVAKIRLDGKNYLCTIFDGDKMLLDIFEETQAGAKTEDVEDFEHDDKTKYILFADDSRFVRNIVANTIKKMGIPVKVFENGRDLLEELKRLNPNEVGLIITDLEMPVMDGKALISEIRKNPQWDHIHILVHTNMSNDILTDSLIELGASEVIPKINAKRLAKKIERFYAKNRTVNAE
ncbi:MAG: chemotaxis protein CheV [Epsilonproteobacteria bacterium]|nr:chemotaxis protein CheV [Campylobacterota bacterium]